MADSLFKHSKNVDLKRARRTKVKDPYEIIANRYFREDDLDALFESDKLFPRQDSVIHLDPEDPEQRRWFET
ncbi:hypothetical protein SAMN05216238_101269 [Lentibacillus persicus]|uniref:Uncharacterized protein n=1 Tax=Lentibacillus persicus TaxID=640948 RepID=A0A1I1S771_9BACI|nr:hypothetical protein [Lentibacillus persicus]SFD42227.1 hypothetical protein SAMN05216238_101269 [Lentibacillus persicus]